MDESKDILRHYEELWKKVKDTIRSLTNNSHNYDEKDRKIKLSSDDDLLLKKTPDFDRIIIVVTFVFKSNKKYCPQVSLDYCLWK